MSIKETETQAPTIEEAIQKGLEKLQAEKNEVDVRILDEGSKGLFGLMGAKPAIVRLKLKNPSMRTQSSSCSTVINFDLAQDKVKKIAKNLLNFMHIKDAEIHTSINDNAVSLSINAPDSSLLIGKQGKTLQALQFLVSLMVSREKETRVNVYIDVNSYRKHLEERLARLAKKAAEEVKASKKIKSFDPMPAHERRIIHSVLKDDTGVITESNGNGLFRKVLIKPKK